MNMRRFEFRWDSKAGPVLLVSIKNKKIGIALLCHRRSDRCLKILGHRSFLCARCTGICIGIVIAHLLLLAKVAVPPFLSAVFAFPLALDGLSQLFGLRKSNNILRLSTGILFSVGLLMFSFGCR